MTVDAELQELKRRLSPRLLSIPGVSGVGIPGGKLTVYLAEAWLGALLDLTPEEMERAITASLQALAGQDQEVQARFRSAVSGAMPRFHSPQFVRMKDAFARIASSTGVEGWS